MNRLQKNDRGGVTKSTLRKTLIGKIAAELRENLEHLNRSYITNSSSDPDLTDTHVLDEYFRTSFSASKAGLSLDPISNPYAIIATGSYGRNEVCRQFDVSILFIFKNDVPQESVGLIREIIYPLWDLGFTISHTTRTISECLNSAGNDYSYLSSLIDSRFICGAWLLYSKLINNLREKVVFNKKKKITHQLFSRDKKRHAKYDTVDYHQEPDLVYSPGGLKDYHSMLSTVRIRSGLTEPKDLVYLQYLSEKEYDALEIAIGFIRETARFLNISTGRSQNRLLMEHRYDVARFMKYKKRGGYTAEDLFYSTLLGHMEHVRQMHSLLYFSILPEAFMIDQAHLMKKKLPVRWLEISRGLISFKSSQKLMKHPMLLLDIFRESERNNVLLSPEAIRLVKEFGFLMDQDMFKTRDAKNIFEELLFSSNMHLRTSFTLFETGVLTRFIPEFDSGIPMPHPAIRAVHPACRQALYILENLKAETRVMPKPPRGILPEEDRLLLMWAGVLYGICGLRPRLGFEKQKFRLAENILIRFEKPTVFIKRVEFLIENLRFFDRLMARKIHGYAER